MRRLIPLSLFLIIPAYAGYETGGALSVPEQIRWLQDPSKPIYKSAGTPTLTPKCKSGCFVSEETKDADNPWSCLNGYAMFQRGTGIDTYETLEESVCPGSTIVDPEPVHNAVPGSANWKMGGSASKLGANSEPQAPSPKTWFGGHIATNGTCTELTADLSASATSASVASCAGMTNGKYVLVIEETAASGGSLSLDDLGNGMELIKMSDNQLGRPPACSGSTMNFMSPYSGQSVRWYSTAGATGRAFDSSTPKTYLCEQTELYNSGPPGLNYCYSGHSFCPKDGNNKTEAQAYADFLLNYWNTDTAGTTHSNLKRQCYRFDVDYVKQAPGADFDWNGTTETGIATATVPAGMHDGYNFMRLGLDEMYGRLRAGMGAAPCVVGGIWNAMSFLDYFNGIQHEGFTRDGGQLTAERTYRWDWGGFNRLVLDRYINTKLPYMGSTLIKFPSCSFPDDKNADRADCIIREPKATVSVGPASGWIDCTGCSLVTNGVAVRDNIMNHRTREYGIVQATADADTLRTFPEDLLANGDEFSIVSTPYEGQVSGTASATVAGRLDDTDGTDDVFCKEDAQPGMIVYNTTDTTYAEITRVRGNCESLEITPDIFTINEGYTLLTMATGRDEQVNFECLTSWALGVPYCSHMTLKGADFGQENVRKAYPYGFMFRTGMTTTGTYGDKQSMMPDPTTTIVTSDVLDALEGRADKWMGEFKYNVDILWKRTSADVTLGAAHVYYGFNDANANGPDTADLEGWTSDNGSVTLTAVDEASAWAGNPFGCEGFDCGAMRLTRSNYQSGINGETIVSPSSDFGITQDRYYLVLIGVKLRGTAVTETRWRPITVNIVGLDWHELEDFPIHDNYRVWMGQILATGTDATARLKLHLGTYELNDVDFDFAGLWERTTPWMGLVMARFTDSAILTNFSGVTQNNISLVGEIGKCGTRPLRASFMGSGSSGAVRFDPDNWMTGEVVCREDFIHNETSRIYVLN